MNTMQLHSEISPIVSPKSLLSISSISPKENHIVSFGSNRPKIFYDSNDNHNQEKINQVPKVDLEASHQINDSATNESYSVDRFTNENQTGRLIDPINSSKLVILQEHNASKDMGFDEETNRTQFSNMIEYEEFVVKEPKNEDIPLQTTSRSKKSQDELQHDSSNNKTNSLQESPKEDERLQPEVEEIVESDSLDDNREKDQEEQNDQFKTKFDKSQLPLQDQSNKVKFDYPYDNGLLSTKFTSKSGELMNTHSSIGKIDQAELCKEISELRDALNQKDDLIDRLKGESQQEDIYQQKIDELERNNSQMNEQLLFLTQQNQEKDLECIRLREKADNQREFILKLEEKYVNIENINFKLDRETKERNQEIDILTDDIKILEEKRLKYKSSIRQKDEQIAELKAQVEGLSKENYSELYVSMLEKTRIYKEKIQQMSKQMDDQKEIIKSKDNAIENLLGRMDELTDSLTLKNQEIGHLRKELQLLKDKPPQVPNTRSEQRPKQTRTNSNPGIYESNREKERSREKSTKGKPTTHLHDSEYYQQRKSAYKENNSNFVPPNEQRKHSDGFLVSDKFKNSDQNVNKNIFSSYDFNDRIKKKNETQNSNSKQWGTLNLRDSYSKGESSNTELMDSHNTNNTKKNSKTKSIDFEFKEKYFYQQPYFQPLEDNKESHNIEDLQRRLAYLKNKRLEFERKKYGVGKDKREESGERLHHDNFNMNGHHKPEQLSLTQTIPNMKSLVGNIHFSSPNAASSKKQHQKQQQLWKEEKNHELKINNFLQEPEHSSSSHPHFRSNTSNNSNQTNISLDEPQSNHKRNSSKSKAKRPPKIDNYYPKQDFNKTENLKNSLKLSQTLSNTSSSTTIKQSDQKQNPKKYYENKSPKVDQKQHFESPGKGLTLSSYSKQQYSSNEQTTYYNKSALKSKEFKELMYRGAVTPSGNLHTSIMEKIMEGKYKK